MCVCVCVCARARACMRVCVWPPRTTFTCLSQDSVLSGSVSYLLCIRLGFVLTVEDNCMGHGGDCLTHKFNMHEKLCPW